MRKSAKSGRSIKHPATVAGYKVMGTTSDGIRVLQPKGKPSFNVLKLRKALKSEHLAKAG